MGACGLLDKFCLFADDFPCDFLPVLALEYPDIVFLASVETVQKVAEDFQFLCVEVCIYTVVVADDFTLLVCEIILGCEHIAKAFACAGDVLVDEVDNIIFTVHII